MAAKQPPIHTRWQWRLALGGTLALLGSAYVVYGGGQHEGPGTVHDKPVPPDAVARRFDMQQSLRISDGTQAKQILFGDLHVHSTFSADAFLRSLPLLSGEGAHPPADACDYARFCSQLDFFSMNDHAESLTPRRWQETKDSVRQCNAVAGDAKSPDLVAFVGWEWSQVGITPEQHYGHKNVIFRDLDDDKLPTRPIAAPVLGRAFNSATVSMSPWRMAAVPILEFPRRQRYLDLATYFLELAQVDVCSAGVDTRKLPASCREVASTPAELFEKLAQWGFESLVIPHGTTWGFYTPPAYVYDKQIAKQQDDPERQRLIEVFSGHGNSEEYRPWRATVHDANGKPSCPKPADNYEPCCHRAGEIIRSRCDDTPAEECERRVANARQRYVDAGTSGHLTVPGATVEDWKDCGQCRDCYLPTFMERPGGSVQYILAAGNFDQPGQPRHALFGFIASSDNHTARPGTGYKEVNRRKVTEATGARDEAWRDRVFGKPEPPAKEARALPRDAADTMPPFRLAHLERQSSFFLTGGLVAVHSEGRDRDAIWQALARREVYGTSGVRMLLWFDMLRDDAAAMPMGSEVRAGHPPKFRVRAAGSFKQRPGCPDWSPTGLPTDRLERLCMGECYHPSDERYRVTRIEVVRIRPRVMPHEPIEPLIEDVWKKLDCAQGKPVCEAEFEDPQFIQGGRDVVYYVRAIQEPTMAINADPLRCERDREGNCIRVRPCYGDYRTPESDECLSVNEERAWSSPIYVRFDAELAKKAAEEAALGASEDGDGKQ